MVNLRGILFMTLSMGGFAVEDLFLKILSETVPVSQILIYVGISATVLLSIISIIKRIPVLMNDIYSNKLFIIRSFADMMGAVLIVTSISLMPLSTVSSILQALPLFITFGAVLIYKESVGWRRWSAVSFGFIGFIDDLKKVKANSSNGISGKIRILLQILIVIIFVYWVKDLLNFQNLNLLSLNFLHS